MIMSCTRVEIVQSSRILTLMGIGSQIRKRREELGLTRDDLARAAGIKVSTLTALETRDSNKSDFFPQIAEALGWKSRTADELGGALVISGPGFSSITPPGMSPSPGGFDLELIRPLRASGEGWEVKSDAGPYAVSGKFLAARDINHTALGSVKVSSDAMHPTLSEGDAALVDTSQTELVDGRVYLLAFDGKTTIARTYGMPGGGLRLKMDNQEHGAIQLDANQAAHVHIVGRVIHRTGPGNL